MHFKLSSAKWRPFCLGLNVSVYTTTYLDMSICNQAIDFQLRSIQNMPQPNTGKRPASVATNEQQNEIYVKTNEFSVVHGEFHIWDAWSLDGYSRLNSAKINIDIYKLV